jgi:hypothetical protein
MEYGSISVRIGMDPGFFWRAGALMIAVNVMVHGTSRTTT